MLSLIYHPSVIPSKNSAAVEIFLTKNYTSMLTMLFFSVLTAKEKPPINVVGDVGGKVAIIVVSLIRYNNSLLNFDLFK